MENYLVSIDSLSRNSNNFNEINPLIHYLPENLKNINYIRLSSIELPTLKSYFSEELKNNHFNISIENQENNFESEKIILQENYYNNDNLSDLPSNFSSSNNLTNFKVELITQNNVPKIKISANENFTLDFLTENHPLFIKSKTILHSNITYSDAKNYLNDKTFYDRINKQVYKEKILSFSSLEDLPTNIIEDFLNTNILFSNLTNQNKDFNIKTPSLGYYLGFRKKIYTGNNEYISEVSPNLNIIKYIFVKVNNYGKILTNHGDSEYLAKVILRNNSNNFDDESNLLTKRHIFSKPEDINKLKISLHDQFGNLINLENQDFSMTLEIGVINNSSLKNMNLKAMP